MDESKGRPWRSELVKARLRMGMSQEEAAEAVGVSPTTWSRWECGEQSMRPVYRVRISEVFNADPMTVEGWLDSKRSTETPMSHVADLGSGSAGATVESFEHLWRCDVDPARRHMLATLPFVPAALGEWLTAWNYDNRSLSFPEPANGPAVGVGDLTRINEAHESFVQIDHQFGAGLIRPAIVDYLATTVAPLLKGRYSDKVGPDLMNAAAGMTQLAGWTAFDLGQQGKAQYYYGQALKLAKAANSEMTAIWVLSTMTLQAIHLEQPTWALRLARAALDIARRVQAPPRVMAMLLSREAWSLALQVSLSDEPSKLDTEQVERLLAEAERTYVDDPTDRDPAWTEWYESTEPVAEAGICWRLIGRPKRGLGCLESIFPQYTQRRFRTIQLTRISMAEAYLGMGELEAALASARAAIPAAQRITSPRLVERVQRFDKQLGPHAKTVKVREFRSYLGSTIAA